MAVEVGQLWRPPLEIDYLDQAIAIALEDKIITADQVKGLTCRIINP